MRGAATPHLEEEHAEVALLALVELEAAPHERREIAVRRAREQRALGAAPGLAALLAASERSEGHVLEVGHVRPLRPQNGRHCRVEAAAGGGGAGR